MKRFIKIVIITFIVPLSYGQITGSVSNVATTAASFLLNLYS